MADFAFQRDTRTQGVIADRVFIGGHEAEFVFGQGTQVFPNLPVAVWGSHDTRTVVEMDAFWFEFAFRIDTVLNGNSAAGFTDAGNYFRFDLEQSTDLQNWSLGKFVPSPTGAVINNGDGTHTYWHRSTVPIWFFNVVCDITISSDRYGKSITGLSVAGVPVSLSYPYAMPSQAAALQTALRAAGFTGALVSSVSKPLTVTAKNYLPDGMKTLLITQSGTSVTMVRDNYGTNITVGMSYPYSMPSQQATLQTDLRAAGQSGAVVILYADEWTILLPDRPAAGNEQRASKITISPGDPYPAFDMFGTYLGLAPANEIGGTSGNVRSAGGTPLVEANKQFARIKITGGSRYNHLMP